MKMADVYGTKINEHRIRKDGENIYFIYNGHQFKARRHCRQYKINGAFMNVWGYVNQIDNDQYSEHKMRRNDDSVIIRPTSVKRYRGSNMEGQRRSATAAR